MKETFLTFYDQYFDDVYRYVYCKTGNRWDTDDLVSEIFRKAYEKFSAVKDHSNKKAWLMTTARNAVIDYYRRKKDESGTALDRLASPHGVEEALEWSVELQCLKKSLSHLSQEDQELVYLRYFSDMKHREIGKVLGKSEEAVKTRISRILKKLGVLVQNCLNGGEVHG